MPNSDTHDAVSPGTLPSITATRDDIQPVSNETADRIATGAVTALPILALIFVGWQLWNKALHWSDLIVLVIMYSITGFGVTIGFHRLFTHRAFKTKAWIRGYFAIAGSMAIEGPVISWVSDHRKHHAFADVEGDPHSPHVEHGHGLKGALRGLLHAHVGWLFLHTQRGSHERYAPDLKKDPVVAWVHKTFLYWAIGGLVMSFLLGWAIGGSINRGWSGLLWGGAVRMLLLHHVTYSINSVCHFFGRRTYETEDESTNVFWLAIPSMGESWHNNHHAFPTSAAHGLKWYQLDLSALTINTLERLGLAWDVVRIAPERMQTKAAAAAVAPAEVVAPVEPAEPVEV